MIRVPMTEDELELAILALEYFRRLGLGEYDDESRAQIARELSALARRFRTA